MLKILTGFLVLLSFAKPATAQLFSKQIKYLSGTDNIHTKEWDFWVTAGRKSGYWTKIQVPSNWEQQGFGTYNFGRDNVNFGKNFQFANEKGIYKCRFEVPADWKNKSVNIVFEGSMTDTEVLLNGKQVGITHQGGFYRFKYNIGSLLKYNGENELYVKVSKMSADASVNNAERLADYWIFGGIYRPVYLEAVPVEHFNATTINAKADGSFTARMKLKNLGAGRTVTAEILDHAGKVVATGKASPSKGDTLVYIKAQCNHPKLWTAETPHLYAVKFSILGGGKRIYQVTEKFGFRTVEVRKQDGIYVNGKKIKLKGINRHVWWPETGRSVNKQIDIADVELIKGMNMNAVRTSHYPPDQTFLDACDSLGLYVVDELAGWQKAYSTAKGIPLVKEMVTRDCNHPSILFWSNGNEGGHNFSLDQEFGKYDLSNRTVIHAHHKPGNAINGIDCNHYEDYYSTEKILRDTNIYMPTEFLHALDDGGGAAGLSDLWDLHWNSKKGTGGFIWALLDEGVVRTDMGNLIDVNGVNGPDGVVGPHREKEGGYNAIREIYSPVKITLKKLPANFNGTIPLENRYNFTDIASCRFVWELVNFRGVQSALPGYEVQKKGAATTPSIKPFEKGSVHLDLPEQWKEYDALFLYAYGPDGKELYKWSWKTKSNEQLIAKIITTKGSGKVTADETDTLITLKAGGISVSISKLNGKIIALANEAGKALPFNNGPVMVSGSAVLKKITHFEDGDAHVLECTYSGDLKVLKWKMYPSGWLELSYRYVLDGQFPYAGISFSFPVNYVFKAKWLGNGPYRVWKNRPFGTSLNVWESMNNDTQTGRSPWVYPEFKGYFADMSWIEFSTVAGKFTVASKQDELFVRLFDFYGLRGPKARPELPPGDISFLDAIPALGSNIAYNAKDNASTFGPMSKLNELHETIERTLYFYFGQPKILRDSHDDKFPQ
jgi:hypothetical protein